MKRFWACFFLCLSAHLWALDSFQARYNLRIRGVNAGEMELKALLNNDTYQLNAHTRPSLAARMLGYGEIQESASGRIKQGILQPQQYQRVMQGDEDYTLRYVYHLTQKKIEVLRHEQSSDLHYEALIPLDILSLIMQCLLDEEHQRQALSYALLSDEKIRSYQVEALPMEKWQDSKGKMIPVHVYRQKSGHRVTQVYFAHHPLRLVQLRQMKNDDMIFVLKLLEHRPLSS